MFITKIPARRLPMLAAACTLISGCMVGPDYVRPKSVEVMPATFRETEAWKIARPVDGDLKEKWWELYRDPNLNALEEQVNVSNQTVIQAEAQYRQATTLVQTARAGLFPTIGAGQAASRTRRAANASGVNPGTATDFQLSLDASWELDIWGRIRRQVEASRAGAQASEADLAAVRLSMQSSLAVDYFQLRTLDAQKKLLNDILASYRESLALTRNRYESGVAAKSDLLQAESQLKTAQAQAVDIDVQRTQLEHAIALLIGKTASGFSLPPAPLDLALPPPAIPAYLPSELLERRPDIAASERLMAEANAQVGVAGAAYYPRLSLSATGGFDAATIAKWFSWPSRFWALGETVTETVFDGGLRQAQTDQARAAYDATVAGYRQTVLTGFQEVEDNLAAQRILKDESAVLAEALTASRQSLAITINQYKAGIVGYLNVIVAQNAELNSEISSITVLGRRMTSNVLLIKALGGGWKSGDGQPAVNPLSGGSPPPAR